MASEAASIDASAAERPSTYEGALAAYRVRRFEIAAAAFSALANNDGPARIFIARASTYTQAPPPAAWDGVTTLGTK